MQEGILSAPVLVAGVVAAAFGTFLGLRRLDEERLPRVGIMAAALFVASFVRFPIGPVSVHLVLNGLAGLLLGWGVFPAFVVALALQAVLLQFGGLTTLGVNTAVMAAPGVLVHVLFRRLVERNARCALLFGGAASALGVALAAGCVFGALVWTGRSFLATAELVLLAHVPVIVIEGIAGGLCIRYLYAVRPQMLSKEAGA